MLCFDNSLLADYLDGRESAREFLQKHETAVWAVPSLALFEAYMGAIYGRPRGSIEDVHDATREFEVLPVTDQVSLTAAGLQRDLKSEGVELGVVDALLVATAADAGATFATADATICTDAVRSRADVLEYDPDAPA